MAIPKLSIPTDIDTVEEVQLYLVNLVEIVNELISTVEEINVKLQTLESSEE